MAYAFRQNSGFADQIRAIAIEQIDRAIEATEARENFDETVHTLRKSCKKLRALVKLVRPAFADYERENGAFRAIADRFSVARDAAVMVQTMAHIIEQSGERLSGDGIGSLTLLDRLRQRAAHLRGQMGEDELLGLAVDDFRAARQRARAWQFDASGADIVEPGLERAYRRFRKRLEKARKSPDGETIHDWRKAAKVWWYLMRLHERTAPSVMDNLTTQLNMLGEALGDHHNLAVLAGWIASSRGPGDGASEVLLTVIADRQTALAEQAFGLGRQLAAERPATAAGRFRAYRKLLG
ncbi:CHAD domain-containing protein [Devosia sp. XK-2]|uniref:CHAD domain-containing protein n=1 Tax=Devosia sp. XK-2 TaxID=3126689 RepID=UPI0030CF4F0A